MLSARNQSSSSDSALAIQNLEQFIPHSKLVYSAANGVMQFLANPQDCRAGVALTSFNGLQLLLAVGALVEAILLQGLKKNIIGLILGGLGVFGSYRNTHRNLASCGG